MEVSRFDKRYSINFLLILSKSTHILLTLGPKLDCRNLHMTQNCRTPTTPTPKQHQSILQTLPQLLLEGMLPQMSLPWLLRNESPSSPGLAI